MCEACHQPDWFCRYKPLQQITNIKTGTLKQPIKIYLAIPYTWNPKKSFEIANKVSADLMSKGYVVFSPISHSHAIADHLPDNLRTDSQWWMSQDLPLVEWSDEVHVVVIGELGNELIEKSKGVQMELKHAKQNFKPVKIYEYYD
jgi:hypothetical protein